MGELKPCPFCGGEAELRSWEYPYVRFQVRCTVCKATGRNRFATEEKAIAAWNTRATSTPSDALVERVAKAIEGPHQPLPPHSATHLGVLRNIRWRNLTTDERQMRLNEARAAIAAIPHAGRVEELTEEQALKLLARRERMLGFSGYADWLDAGCPASAEHIYPQEKLDDIRFYARTALQGDNR